MPRFVFVSTCAVHEVILDDRPLDETHPLWPTSHYGAHKAALEAFVHSFGLGQGWPICALRPTGIYGLAHPARDSRWYDLVGQVLRGEPIDSPRRQGSPRRRRRPRRRAVAERRPKAIAGQAFNCYDMYVAEQKVARMAKELTGSPSDIAELNRGPKNQIDTRQDPSSGHDVRRRGAAAAGRCGTGRGSSPIEAVGHCAGPPRAPTPAAGEVPMGCRPDTGRAAGSPHRRGPVWPRYVNLRQGESGPGAGDPRW